MLTEWEEHQLRYLDRQGHPCWGGHLERKQPLMDETLRRWLKLGVIEQIEERGYMLTRKGRSLIGSK